MFGKKKFGGVTVDGVPVKEEKNWGAQILVSLAWGLLFVGPWVAVVFFVVSGKGCHDGDPCARTDRSTHMSVAAVALIVVLDVFLLMVIAARMVRNSRSL